MRANIGRTVLAALIFVASAGFINCSGGGGGGGGGLGGDTAGNGIDLSGGVSIPSSDLSGGVGIPSSDRKFRDLAPSGAKPHLLRWLADESSGGAGSTVELLNSEGQVLATTECDDSGNYTFEDIDPATLADADTSGYDTFYIRSTTTGADGQEIVQMNTVSLPDSDVDSDLTDLNVDYASTAETMLIYSDSGVNPLTEDFSATNPTNVAQLDDVYGPVVSDAANELTTADEISDLQGQTMDDAAGMMLLAAFALTGDATDATPADCMYDLFTAAADSDTADTLGAEVQAESGFETVEQSDLEQSLSAMSGLDDAVDNVWLSNSTFTGLDSDVLSFYISSALNGSTLTQFNMVNATADLFAYQLQLLNQVDYDSLYSSVGLDTMTDAFSQFFSSPELILGMGDAEAAGVIEALITQYFSATSTVDPSLIGVVCDALSSQSSDASFFDTFYDGGALSSSYVSNFTSYFYTADTAGYWDSYYSFTVTYNWTVVIDSISYTYDYSTDDAATFTSTNDSYFESSREDIVADSCDNFCGSYNPVTYCWCDDYCTAYGDCCLDKVSVCGESYSATTVAGYGYDLASAAVDLGDYDTTDMDGDGIADADDNCPYDYDPGNLNSDADYYCNTNDDDDDDDWCYDYEDPTPITGDHSDCANGAYVADNPLYDYDGDGVPDVSDLCTDNPFPYCGAADCAAWADSYYYSYESGIIASAYFGSDTSYSTYIADNNYIDTYVCDTAYGYYSCYWSYAYGDGVYDICETTSYWSGYDLWDWYYTYSQNYSYYPYLYSW